MMPAATLPASAPAQTAAFSAVASAAAAPAPAAPAAAPAAAAGAHPAAGSASPSLYVGDLDPTVTEAMLFELFSMIGPVTSIRVCRDAVTRRSLGYAYVNYQNAADCERALEALNYSVVKGRPLRIMWSQRDPSLRRAGTGNIFIKNLDPSIDNKALHDTFIAFGNILSCKIATDEVTHESKGYGFVHYETMEAAEAAIANVNGMLLNDLKVFVGLHVPRKERVSKLEELKNNFTNIYVKNLPEEMSDDDLRELFAKFGEMVSCVVQRDEAGKSRGFGFINYTTHESAKDAVDAMNEHEVSGKHLYVSRAQKKAERQEELRKVFEKQREERNNKYQGVNLFVKNLDDAIDEETLRNEFAPYGIITSARIMTDDKGTSRGFGFVCFSSPDEATKAVNEMNNRMLGNKPIYVALAQRKEVRKQQLAAQMSHRRQQMAGVPSIAMYPGQPQMFYPPMPQRGGMYFPQQMLPRPFGRPGALPQGYPPHLLAAAPGGFPPAPGVGPQGVPGGMPPRVAPVSAAAAVAGAGAVPGARVPPGAAAAHAAAAHAAAAGGRPPMPGAPGAQGAMPPAGALPHQVGRGRAAFKYTANTRNAPMPGAGAAAVPGTGAGLPMHPAAMGPGVVMGPGGVHRAMPPAGPGAGAPDGGALSASRLASMDPADQKQHLGEALFPIVFGVAPEYASKVTGMMLEMDNAELLHLLESPEALNQKIRDAVTALQAHQESLKQQATKAGKGDAAPASAAAAAKKATA